MFIDDIKKENNSTILQSIYFEKVINGNIIKSINNKYVRMYEISDINYTLNDIEEKINILKQYMNLFNNFDENVGISLILTKKNNTDDFLIDYKDDQYQNIRKALNETIEENVYKKGYSYIIKKYICIDISEKDENNVINRFDILDELLRKNFFEISGCNVKGVHDEWITKLLYFFYNPLTEHQYKENKLLFTEENLNSVKVSVKEAVAPSIMNFYKQDVKLNDKFIKLLYLKSINKQIKTSAIGDLLMENVESVFMEEKEITICIKIRQIEISKAIKMARKELGNVEGDIYNAQNKLGGKGVSIDLVPRKLKQRREEALYINDSLLKRDENLFNLSIYAMVNSDTRNEAKDTAYKFIKRAKSCGLTFVVGKGMQEKIFNSILPYGVNQTPYSIIVDTESLCGFNIFNAIDIIEKDGDYYGKNKLTNNPIKYNIMSGDNYSTLIMGMTGKGKSFVAKLLLILRKIREENREVVVIDPNGEWGEVVKKLGGEEINLTSAGENHINLFEIDKSYGNNPVADKEDFILSVCSLMLRKELTAGQRTIISVAISKIYEKWNETKEDQDIPTLEEFADTLKEIIISNKSITSSNNLSLNIYNNQNNDNYIYNEDVELLRAILYYSETSHCEIFRGVSKVKIHTPIICFNLKDLGNDLKPLAMEVLCDNIWVRICKNRERRIPTDVIIDEFHLMSKNALTANWMAMYWKMLRKYLGCPIGITQNPEDVLSTEEGRNVINNTSFSVLLSLLEKDRQLVKEIWKITNESLYYITDKQAGEGIIIFGAGKNINKQVVIPFKNPFKKNNEIYKLINTSYDEE